MRLCLAMVTADGDERRFPISGTKLVLGSHSRCDVRLAVPSVSERHCEIMVDGEVLTLKDLGSGTGTFHNGSKVEHAVLSAEDRLTIGPVTFVIRTEPAEGEGTAVVTEVKPRKTSDAGSTGQEKR